MSNRNAYPTRENMSNSKSNEPSLAKQTKAVKRKTTLLFTLGRGGGGGGA